MKEPVVYYAFPCKGCTERTVEPRCHSTCERYLDAKKKNDEAREIDAEYKRWSVNYNAHVRGEDRPPKGFRRKKCYKVY